MADFTSTQPVADPDLFVGRHKIIAAFADHIRSTVFVGEARIGKTSLLLHLKRELQTLNNQLVPRVLIYMNLRNPNFQESREVYHSIGSHITEELKKLDRHHSHQEDASLSESTRLLRFLEHLDTSGHRLEIVTLIDNLVARKPFSLIVWNYIQGSGNASTLRQVVAASN